MTDAWLNALNNGNLVGCVLVDFHKAFDLVDHILNVSIFNFCILYIFKQFWTVSYVFFYTFILTSCLDIV